MRRQPLLAQRFFDRYEPVHAVTYFAPEARAALDALGYRGFWMGYFAARSARLGAVPREVVAAIFYNFAPERVAKALPAAWEIAGPQAALRARQESAVAALGRYGLHPDENVAVAAELAAKAARGAPLDGRPLFAANLALPWPEDPLAALWHATTLLREQRGDAHVAVLAAAGISGRESNVLHAAAGNVSRDYIARTRDYDEASWRRHEQRLAERGLLDGDGADRRRPTVQGPHRSDHRRAGPVGAQRADRRRGGDAVRGAHPDHPRGDRRRRHPRRHPDDVAPRRITRRQRAFGGPMSGRPLPGGVVHKLPADLRESLIGNATALAAWNDITPLARNEFICWVEDAKQQATRERRIRRTVEELEEGKRRPCCWPGCKHRERTGK